MRGDFEDIRMKKKLNIMVVCLLCLFVTVPSFADMRIKLQDGQYGDTGGGEFLITVLEDPIGIYDKVFNPQFMTFCIETNEYVSYNEEYYVTIDTGAWNGGNSGGTPDTLSPESAYLYSLWLDGTDGINSITHSLTTANALQRAIWYLEDEGAPWGSNLGDSGTYIGWAMEAVTSDGDNDTWFDTWGNTIGDIRVMNLWKYENHTGLAQDQLVRVPVPGAVLLGLLGLSAAGLKLRKFA